MWPRYDFQEDILVTCRRFQAEQSEKIVGVLSIGWCVVVSHKENPTAFFVPQICARQTHLSQTGANGRLTGDESRTSGGAALPPIPTGGSTLVPAPFERPPPD